MANPCEGCKLSCCVNFIVTTEYLDPTKHKENISRFSFLHSTGKKLIQIFGHKTVLTTYSCDRFQSDTGICQDYDSVPRPDFCKRTGINNTPHPNCQLQK